MPARAMASLCRMFPAFLDRRPRIAHVRLQGAITPREAGELARVIDAYIRVMIACDLELCMQRIDALAAASRHPTRSR